MTWALQGNPLVQLEENLFYGLRESQLEQLNLQDCQLQHIAAHTLRHLHSLQHLDLYSNPALLALDGTRSPLSAALFYLPSKQFTSLGLANNEVGVSLWFYAFG